MILVTGLVFDDLGDKFIVYFFSYKDSKSWNLRVHSDGCRRRAFGDSNAFAITL